MSALSEYISDTGRLPDDALLGHIVFSTGAEGPHDREALVAAFEERDLNASLIPKLTGSVNAFKKAAADVQDSKYALPEGAIASVQFREVASANPREIDIRQMWRETRVDANHTLGWEPVGEAKLFRPHRTNGVIDESSARLGFTIRTDLAKQPEARDLMRVCSEFMHQYETYRLYLDGAKIRQLIRDYLKYLDGIPMLRQATAFVPAGRTDELVRFSEAIAALKGCKVSLIPLVNLQDARGLVLEAFDTQNADDAADLVLAMKDVERVTPRVYAQLLERYQALAGRTKTYAELLDDSVLRRNAHMELAKAALAKLAERLTKEAA